MRRFNKLITACASFLVLTTTAFAYSGDMSINDQDLRFSSGNFLEGRTIRIYASVTNNSDRDLLGIVRFFDNDNQISGDQAISIFVNKTDDVFIDWTPSFGSHKIAAKIFPWDPDIDDPSNNWVVTTVFAVQDTDNDGDPNETDLDDDNDGVPDEEDAYPLNPNEQFDTDGDGAGDNSDEDDDNDGVPDTHDDLPLNPNETIDTDKDGIGNIADPDDDNDQITDTEEENTGTDPLNPDTDGDETDDKDDAFPLDPDEQLDTDNDSIGNNTDIDDDNDGIPDKDDEYPLNKGPVLRLSEEDFTVGLFEKQIFDASPSFDEDGKIVSYEWEIDGQPAQEGNAITTIFDTLGKHRVKVTVTDDSGESRTSEFEVNVLNIGLYWQIGLTLIAILLAMILYFKYIHVAKNSKETSKKS